MKINLFLILFLLSTASIYAQQFKGIEPSKAEAKKMTTITADQLTKRSIPHYIKDVVYANRSDMDLHLQVILPDRAKEEKLPCVVYIQGSAWFKQNCYAALPKLIEFSNRGYAIVSVEYRPSTTANFPAQIQDVKSAIRFVRKNAQKYGIDVNNLFIWGDSSGGHLSLLGALTQDIEALDTAEEFAEESIAVNACVAYYPVSDLTRVQEFAPDYMDHISEKSPTGVLFGGVKVNDNLEKIRVANPVSYVSKDRAVNTVPIVIVTGNRDNVLPFEQSVIMADKLEECGYNYKFYKIEGADHGSWEFWTKELFDLVDNFFKANMK